MFNFYFGDSEPTTLWHDIRPYFDMLFGLGISVLLALIIRFVEKKSVGKNYLLQLKGLKKPLIEQIKSIKEGIEGNTKVGEAKRIMLYHHSKFSTIRNLDRLKIVAYMKWQEPFRSVDNSEEYASERISSILYSFDALCEQSKYLEQISDEFIRQRKLLISNYAIHFILGRRAISKYLDGLPQGAKVDVMVDKFVNLIQSKIPNNTLEVDVIINLYQSSHKPFVTELFYNQNSVLHEELTTYIQNASDVVVIYMAEEKEYYDKLGVTLELYKSAFNNIYSEEIDKYLS